VLVVVLGAALALVAAHDAFEDTGTPGLHGSGVAAADSRILPPFHELELAGGNVVTIRVGPSQSVVVHADDNLLDSVTTEVVAGRLVVGTTGTFDTRSPMSVDVTVPSLTSLALSGSGIVTAEGVDAAALTVALPGSGVVRAAGTVDRLDVSLGGSGDAQLGDLVARDVRAAVPGSGRIVVHATQSLDASVSGSGAILYGGSPERVTKNVTGSGAVVEQ
jgi:hypothetical protein